MTPLHVKTCQRCYKPTTHPVTIVSLPTDDTVKMRLVKICPLCYVQLLAWLHETLEVVKAHDLPC